MPAPMGAAGRLRASGASTTDSQLSRSRRLRPQTRRRDTVATAWAATVVCPAATPGGHARVPRLKPVDSMDTGVIGAILAFGRAGDQPVLVAEVDRVRRAIVGREPDSSS